jgi:hypothetical protein
MAASDRGPGWSALSDLACHRGTGSSSRAPGMAAWLQTRAARLDELGIAYGGIVDAHYGSGVSFRDPDGIALEFFAPPA